MAKRKGGQSFSIAVEGLDQLRALPGFIDRGQRELLDKGASGIRDAIRAVAPGGPSGTAGRAVQSRTLSSTRALVGSFHFAGARALERGAFIRPKKGKALRFQIQGKTVFTRRGVRIEARGYHKKGLRARGRIIRAAYHDAFGDVTRRG